MPVTGPTELPPSKRRAPTGRPSRRKLDRKAPPARVPAKAKEAVDRLPDKVRARPDRKPTAPKDEIEREDRRDANGLFTKGTKPGPGRPPGSPNKIPKSIKEVMRALSEGAIEVGYPEPLTGQPTTGPVAHLLAEKIVEGLNLPAKDAHAYVKTMLEYSIGRPKTMEQGTGEHLKQIPRSGRRPQRRDRRCPDRQGRGSGTREVRLRGRRPWRGRGSIGTGRGSAFAMPDLRWLRPAGHRVWLANRAVR